MAQIGIYSASLLAMHDHSNASMGGRIIWEERIVGAAVTTPATLNAAVRTTGLGVMTLLKQIRINEISPGTLTVYYNVWRGIPGNVESAVYRNGVIVGAVFGPEDPGGFAGLQHSRVVPVDLAVGDTIEIWGRVTTAVAVFVGDQYLEYSYGVVGLSDRAMNPLLGTTYAVPVPQTNIL